MGIGLYHSFISHLFHMMTHFSDAHLGFQKAFFCIERKEWTNKQTNKTTTHHREDYEKLQSEY